ncbi:hypothetical protein V2G26_008010 [Clonostachys chloroleuca]
MIGMIFITQLTSLVGCVLGCDGDENSAEQPAMHTHTPTNGASAEDQAFTASRDIWRHLRLACPTSRILGSAIHEELVPDQERRDSGEGWKAGVSLVLEWMDIYGGYEY